MCLPAVPLIMMALSVAQTANAYQTQKGQAKFAQQSATVKRNSDIAGIRSEQVMAQQDQAERVESLRRQTEKQQATARVAGADAGVTGTSVDSIMNELAGQNAEAQQNLETNYARSALGTSNQLFNADSQYSSTVAQNQKPSGLAAALQIGGAVAEGYGGYKQATAGGTK